MKKISVSLLSSKDVKDDIKVLSHTDCDLLHIDVMDGRFVRHISFPFKKVKNIGLSTSKRLDVHLMVKNAKKYIKQFVNLNCEYITFHIEVKQDINELIDLIHSYGIKAGIAIKPGTDLSIVAPYLKDIDLILVMSVEPGKGGQEFLSDSTHRINALKNIIKKKKLDIVLSVDGGINDKTRPLVEKTDIIVAGSFITGSENYQSAINILR